MTKLIRLRTELERVIYHTDDGAPITEVDARLMLALVDTADASRYAVDELRTSGLHSYAIEALAETLNCYYTTEPE
jgi:hypothetical protein